MFKALALCQNSKLKKEENGDTKQVFTNTEEKALLKAAEAFGFWMLEKLPNKKKVARIENSITNDILEYKVIGTHNHEETWWYGVLVRELNEWDTIFYAKGPTSMLETLEEDALADGNFEQILNYYFERYLKVVIVAKKVLLPEEYDKRKREVLSLGAGQREWETDFWNEYFSDLKLVGLVAMDDMIDLRVSITLDEL